MNSKKSTSTKCSASVIIPIFNESPEYLQQAIYSAFETFSDTPIEVIVCDDGSTHDLSKAYKETCNSRNVTFLRLHRNMGMNVARNMAALQAVGEYLVLLDSDDILTGKWSPVFEEIISERPWVAFADHSQYDEDLCHRLQTRKKCRYFEIFKLYAHTIHDPFLHSTFLFHPQIYRRDKFLDAGGFNCSYSSGDEIAIQLKILRNASKQNLAYFPEELYKYRKNPRSVVHDKYLYRQLIKNIEAILRNEFCVRHNITVSVRRHGRETEFGAAHYNIFLANGGEKLQPPWFDLENMRFRTLLR